jgi:uncharacterized protein (TIGR00299 family) protein
LKVAYFDCFSGASGDMLLGCLLDAGLSLEELRSDLHRLDMGPYRLVAEKVTRRGLTGTHLRVLPGAASWPATNLPAIQRIIDNSDLTERIKARSLAVFQRLARAEASIHGTPLDEVHFHEIGAVDSLVDIVGFVCALERQGIEAAYASALTLGSGTVETEHGLLPVPAPATLALLAEAHAPTAPSLAQTELVTPTGAALLAEFATFQQPAMSVEAIGYGFGTRELEWPNALRVWLGEGLPSVVLPDGDRVVQLACNLDDATGELLGYVMDRLLAAGALDVWFTPIQMKKNRPATQVSLLAQPEDADRLAALLLRETPTLGVRRIGFARYKAHRELREVQTPWGPVRVKEKRVSGQILAFSPEYDDCARLAAMAGVPLDAIMAAARRAAEDSGPGWAKAATAPPRLGASSGMDKA